MTLLGVILHRHVGNGTPAIVATGHVDTVEQQVGLDRQELAARDPHRLLNSVRLHYHHRLHDNDRLIHHQRLRIDNDGLQLRDGGFRLSDDRLRHLRHIAAEHQHDAGRAQTGEVLAQQAAPQLTATGCLQLALQLSRLATGLVAVNERLHVVVVRVVGTAHHQTEGGIVLDIHVELEGLSTDGEGQARLDEAEQGLCALVAQALVHADGTLGRGCATDDQLHQLKAVAVDLRQHHLVEFAEEGVCRIQPVLADGEHHLTGNVEEVLIAHPERVAELHKTDIRIGRISRIHVLHGRPLTCAHRSRHQHQKRCQQEYDLGFGYSDSHVKMYILNAKIVNNLQTTITFHRQTANI